MKWIALINSCLCLCCAAAEAPVFAELPDAPAQLIETLKKSGDRYYVSTFRLNYITESDLPHLIELLDSTEPCACVDLSDSSIHYPGRRSTVGHEAAYLIEGFWKRYYPTTLTSQHYKPDVAEIKRWYQTWNQLQKLRGQDDSTNQSRFPTGPKQSSEAQPRFALYLVRTPHADIAKTELESTPAFTEDDIVAYDWPTHIVSLTESARKKLPSVQAVGTGGKQFVIVVDGQRCYRGAFWISYSSIGTLDPVIDVTQLGTTVRIERAYPSGTVATGDNPRSDPFIKRVLVSLRKITQATKDQ
jgi:hypothetical protein